MGNEYNCPECKDTGVYQGLNTVEPCRACGGKDGFNSLGEWAKAVIRAESGGPVDERLNSKNDFYGTFTLTFAGQTTGVDEIRRIENTDA